MYDCVDVYFCFVFYLTRLYNKDSVIEYLLDKSKFEGVVGFEHIRGLKVIRKF